MYYAGIGSRETPESIKPLIFDIAKRLNTQGYVLRSGGANGADSFFAEYSTRKEIYLPWKGYNEVEDGIYGTIPVEAYEMAAKFHPAWDKLSSAVKSIMARNSMQIFGQDMKTPVEFVVCWTKDGKLIGGTAQAMRIAKAHDIPIYNLALEKDIDKLMSRIKTQSLF